MLILLAVISRVASGTDSIWRCHVYSGGLIFSVLTLLAVISRVASGTDTFEGVLYIVEA